MLTQKNYHFHTFRYPHSLSTISDFPETINIKQRSMPSGEPMRWAFAQARFKFMRSIHYND